MSGYAGIISANSAPPDRALLERIAASLAFRGPDATHVTAQSNAGFVFTFLRTGPAPQSHAQPCTLDNRLWLVGDVRLDGREDLRRKLEQQGASIPSSATDEELILHAYRTWRDESLPQLLGDFSFALWDSAARTLLGVRDLLGLKPFFHAQTANHFCVGNTIEALRLIPEVSSTLDPFFIADFLLQESSADPERTAFRDIRRLPPGHALRLENASLQIRRYTSLPIEEPLSFRRPEECTEQFRALLDIAIRDRLPHNSTAIFMSGGLDSTSIAAVAVADSRRRAEPLDLRAYTIDAHALFPDREGELASLVARHLGIPIEILSAASCLPFTDSDDSRLRTPEPIHEPFLQLARIQYQQAASVASVGWTGLGGDDVLTGQAWPYLTDLLRRGQFSTALSSFGSYIVRNKKMPSLRGGFRSRLQRWFRPLDPMREYPDWLEPQFAAQYDLRGRWIHLQHIPDSPHPIHPKGYAGLASDFWSQVFEAEDAGWTLTPMELRAPLLDVRVLRFLLRLPSVPWCMEKHLLREITRDLLPQEIRLRPKTPLAGDLLEANVIIHRWKPVPLPQIAPGFSNFVDWKRLRDKLESGPLPSSLWTDLRPLSLLYWLKNVENSTQIR